MMRGKGRVLLRGKTLMTFKWARTPLCERIPLENRRAKLRGKCSKRLRGSCLELISKDVGSKGDLAKATYDSDNRRRDF